MPKANVVNSFVFTLALTFSGITSSGQLSVTAVNTPLVQNFNTLAASGTGTQSGGIFTEGWSFWESSAPPHDYQAGTGSNNNGDTYSFGTSGATERSLGMLQSGSLTSIPGMKITNNTGQTISSLTIGFTGEVWRLSTAADVLSFSYQPGNVALNATSGWITVPGLDFTTPVTGAAAAVDGNSSGNRTVISPVTITGLYMQPGTILTFRWVDATASSSAAMAIDDFSITLIPASTAYFRSRTTGNWNAAGTWEKSLDGVLWSPSSNEVPTDLAAGVTIAGGHTVTISSDVTVNKLLVKAGGKLVHTGGTLKLTDGPGHDLLLEGSNSSFDIAAATGPSVVSNATIRIGTGAVLTLSGNSNLLSFHGAPFSYADGAIFEYAHSAAPVVTGTFFSTQDPGAIPVFRYRSGYSGSLGSAGATTINGKLEVAAGAFLNLSGVSGTLVIRNGITGAGNFQAATTALLTGTSAELGGAGTINSNVTIQNGCTTTLSSGKTFSDKNTLTIDGALDAGAWQLQTTTGTARFGIGATGIVKTANAAGLVNTSGTLKTGCFTVTLAAGSTIDYNAAGAQVITITGAPAYQNLLVSGAGTKTVQSGANLVVQGSCTVASGATLVLSGLAGDNLYLNSSAQLEVRSGATFDNGGESAITYQNGLPSVTVRGTFITRDQQGFLGSGTALPSILPVLDATGTVEYGRAGDQSVQATITYGNLVFSGSGTKTPGNAIALSGSVTISGSVILDGSVHSIGGDGNALVMTGTSRFRVGGTGTKPDLAGTYTLAPTTIIEFANSNATTCTIRQYLGPNSRYANIEITGSNVSAPGSGITLQPTTKLTVRNGGGLKVSSVNGLYASSNAAVLSVNNPALVPEVGSEIDYNGADQVLTTGYAYSHLRISGTGVKTAPSVFTVGQSFTRSGGASLGGSSPSFQLNAVLNYSDAGAGRTYTTGPEWPSANPPAHLAVNLTGTGNPSVLLNNDKTVPGSISLLAGSLHLNGQALTVSGGITGTGTLGGSSGSSLIVNGGISTLNFLQATDAATNALGSLTINSGTVTLGNRLHIYRVLNLGGGSLNLNNQSLVLKSTEAQTARVAERKGLLTGATNVTVERSVASQRRWRLLTSPVLNTSINAAWQEGRRWTGSVKDNLSPGFGTLITGQQQGTQAKANSNGFDFWTAIAGSVASIRRYSRAASYTQALWLPLDNTTSTGAFNNHEAYLLFVRGDRSVSTESGGTTVLRATGALKEATNYSLPVSATQSHTLIGNPFASPVHFETIYRDPANAGTVQPFYWTWQAALGTSGGYRLIKPDGTGGYEAVPGGEPVLPLIASGEGFFVLPVAKPLSANLVIRQSHKTANAPLQPVLRQDDRVKREQRPPKVVVNLYEAAPGNGLLLDGVLAEYKSRNGEDIAKAANSGENLSVQKRGRDLIVVASTVYPRPDDTLQLRLWNTSQKEYRLELRSAGLPPGLAAVLVDRYQKTEMPVLLQGKAMRYRFRITPDEGSRDPLRFCILFRRGPFLSSAPWIVSRFTAGEAKGGVLLRWEVEEEESVLQYEPQKSADGQNFRTLGTQRAGEERGRRSYEWMDATLFHGTFYRLRAVSQAGSPFYTEAIKLVMDKRAGGNIGVYPNPVSGNSLPLHFLQRPPGLYTLLLVNGAGQTVLQSMIRHAGGSATYHIPLAAGMATGYYSLQVKNKGFAEKTIAVFVNR